MSPAKVEQRLAAMEEGLARLKSRVDGLTSSKPWWEQIARGRRSESRRCGVIVVVRSANQRLIAERSTTFWKFQGDPVCAEAMKLGQQYRRSQRPERKSSMQK